MQTSVFSVALGTMPFPDAMKWLATRGVSAVELGCGGTPGKAHCDASALIRDDNALDGFRTVLASHHMTIAALSCHGNPVHPDATIAKRDHEDFRDAILLAEQLGVRCVVGFSGCPGGSAMDQTPNWVTCAWPDDFQTILDYQWNTVLIPYWRDMAGFAAAHGVEKIALEMHPGFCVYNPATLLRLRAAVGPVIGANVDPSHLFWQGIDPAAAVRELGQAVHFVHAKDTAIDPYRCAINGVLETRPMNESAARSWNFRTLGYGHSQLVWNQFVSALKQAGYDAAVSIEHEDSLMSPEDGLEKAIQFLSRTLPV